PQVCVRNRPVPRVRASGWNIANLQPGTAQAVKFAGSKVLSSSTCTMSGYGAARVPGPACFSTALAVAAHARCAVVSSDIAGMVTPPSLMLMKKLVSWASSESLSHTSRLCSVANGPAGSRHTRNATAHSSTPPARQAAAHQQQHARGQQIQVRIMAQRGDQAGARVVDEIRRHQRRFEIGLLEAGDEAQRE